MTKRFLTLAIVVGMTLPLFAASAQAGAPVIVQGHPFKLSVGLLGQAQKENGDGFVDKDKANEKDLGANCLQEEKLAKDQAVIVTLNDACNDPNDNSVDIIRTDPFLVLDTLGGLTFDLDLAIATEKNGDLQTLTVPVEADLACLGTVNVDLDLGGVATVKIDEDGCVESVKMKGGLGLGTIDGEDVIIDKAAASAGKKKASFVDVN